MCHAYLHDPGFARLLVRIDQDFATSVHVAGCRCGGDLHRADYPRKPRGCAPALRADFSSRRSFCCAICRKRSTSMSVRFLGRRVYVMLAVVLLSTRSVMRMSAAAQVASWLQVPVRTLRRWRTWWTKDLVLTPFWLAVGSLILPVPDALQFPDSLLATFGDRRDPDTPVTPAALLGLMRFLSPLTVQVPIALDGGR